ncbi:DUF2842 domain-containing protein [Sphingomonas donggukensis]|uniref:DUF2842 domain-containing protein n=1 Tax=Sphingomonas donggukensis TaxID=2949093 RepID=A0ABY4TVZ4_9SPHN|nr:DUF2842 domain-containing protein [Sphingomonas donggukensis]URW76547.1 DUF2842 domain-containing protein [Sphingomonas donggukensis]
MTPSWRKPVGMLGILAYVTIWVVAIASFSGAIGSLPALVQLPIYLVAGIVWICPLRPALQWMETGRWR